MRILYQIMPRRQAQTGFTLVELVITLLVLALLSGLGLPQLSGFLERHRLTSARADLRASLAFARGEAVRRAAQVSLCRRSPEKGAPACALSGRDWSHGWLVFVDRSAETGSRDPVVGEILHVHAGFAPRLVINFTAPRGASLTYDAEGWPDRNFVGGSFTFCAPQQPSLGLRLVNSRLGRLRPLSFNCRG